MTATSTYVVLVDVVDSRKIDDREAFESRLASAFEHVNDAESSAISTPFTQMKGIDEFGCVLTSIAVVPDVVSVLLDRIHPSLARFGIASGEIDVGAERDTVAEMDGPAFHRASAILEDLADAGLYAGVDARRQVDDLVSSALNLLVMERRNLTDRQVEVILTYERCGTQAAAADELGLQQQSVSNTLRRANYGRRKAIRGTLRETLAAVYG